MTTQAAPSSTQASSESSQMNSSFTSAQSEKMNFDTAEFNPLDASSTMSRDGVGSEWEENEGNFKGNTGAEKTKSAAQQVVQELRQESSQEEPAKAAVAAEEDPDDKTEELDRVSRGLSKLARKDAALREKEKSLKEQESKLEKLLAFAQELEEDPASAISKLGLDADKLYATEFEKKQREELTKVERLEKRLDEMREELKKKETETEIRTKGDRWESDFTKNFDDDQYKLVKAWDPTGGIVRKLVADRYHQTGKLMSPWKALGILQEQIHDKMSRMSPAQVQEKKQESKQKSNEIAKSTQSLDAGEFSPSVKTNASQQSRKGNTIPANVGSSPTRMSRELLSDDEDMERISRKYEQLLRR